MSTFKPRKPPIRAIFLDFHGTAVPYCSASSSWLSAALSHYNQPPFSPLLCALFNGAWREEALKFVYEWDALASKDVPYEAFCALYTAARTAAVHSRSCNPGVLELLEVLRTRAYVGYATEEESRRRKERIELILVNGGRQNVFAGQTDDPSGLRRYFADEDACVTVGDLEKRGRVPRKKPNPDVYLLALETVNARRAAKGLQGGDIEVEECLVLEDSFNGVRSAMQAGMEVVWVPEKEVRELMGVIVKEGDPVERLIGGHEVKGDEEFVRRVMGEKVRAGLEALKVVGGRGFLEGLEGVDVGEWGVWVDEE